MAATLLKEKSVALRGARETGSKKVLSLSKIADKRQAGQKVAIQSRSGKVVITESVGDTASGSKK